MRYTVTVSMKIEARDDSEAHEHALKLKKLLESPLVRIAVESEGVKLAQGASPVVYQPQRG
jgi:hypothetical protein